MAGTRSNNLYETKLWNTPLLLLSTFFLVVGGTLGSGIMVLPTELSRSGFWSFLYLMIFPFTAEVISIIIFFQVMQKVRSSLASNNEDDKKHDEAHKNYSKKEIIFENSSTEEEDDDSMNENLLSKKKSKTNEKSEEEKISSFLLTKGIDLHTIGKQYFKNWYCFFADFLILLKNIPIVYVVGSCQSLVAVFTANEDDLIYWSRAISPIITIISFIFVFIFSKWIEAVIGTIACFKSTLLFFVVLFGLGVISSFNSIPNAAMISRPYFSETLLITGSIMILPNLFSRLRQTKKNVLLFLLTVLLGLSTAQLIGFLWALCVWGVVPQFSSNEDEVSLDKSLKEGEYSNIPFGLVLEENRPGFMWMSYFIEIFVTISFMFASLLHIVVFKSTIDGYFKDIFNWVKKKASSPQTTNTTNILSSSEEEEEEEDEEEKKKKEKEERKRREERSMKGIGCGFIFLQIIIYVFTTLIVAVGCLALFHAQYLLNEVSSFLMILFYIFYVCGLAIVDIVKNPLASNNNNNNNNDHQMNVINVHKNKKDGNKDKNLYLPRWLFITLSVLITCYFVFFVAWFYIYYTAKYFSMLADVELKM